MDERDHSDTERGDRKAFAVSKPGRRAQIVEPAFGAIKERVIYPHKTKAMSKLEELQQKQAAMPLSELLEKCDNELSKLCKTGGKSIHMSVPPDINDTDMLLSEALRRLESLTSSHREKIEALERKAWECSVEMMEYCDYKKSG